jgi:non-specific serine/threonine protein kinase
MSDDMDELFHELIELPPDERRAKLEALGRSDRALRDELESLLRAFLSAPQFLAPPERARSSTPVHFGKYEIVEEIDRGGAGIVYLARDPDLGRLIAIKTLVPLPRAEEERARLREEARLLASVLHPNVAQVHSIEEDRSEDGEAVAFLTMEYVPGLTLARRLKEGPLAPDIGLDMGRQIAAAIEAAHACSVIHRDLKPQNIRITPQGWVKVLDFGLATLTGDSADPASGRRRIGGTPGYMSPEQCRGQQLTPASDLWAFGCVLHECLLGTPAIRGTSLGEILEANRRGETAVDRLPESISKPLRDLLRDCLQPEPSRRPTAVLARRVLEEELLRARAMGLLASRVGIRQQGAEREAERTAEAGGKRGYLPLPLSSFVGRGALLDTIAGALAAHRLVTLTGPGGVGKTRISLEAASRRESMVPGGVWFVDLAALTNGAEAPAAVARALGIREIRLDGEADRLVRSIAAAFHRDPALLVLDNCEHLVEAVARLAEQVLTLAPAVSILATSRQSLAIAGEQVVPVPPLGIPAESQEIGTAAEAEAVQLFLGRARSRDPRFSPNEEDLETVVRICRRLDGLPLAIELAAAPVRSLPLEEILARIEEGRSLPGELSTVPRRHRSLHDLLSWSDHLLQREERALLRRLSVFRGGTTLADAEEVCGGWGGIERWRVCDLLTRLVERSLVEPEITGRSRDAAPAARYRMLETIRAFSSERLDEEPGERAEVESRYLGRLLATAALRDPERQVLRSAWVRRIEPDYPNLLNGIDLALSRDRLDAAFALGDRLAYYWLQKGLWIEGLGWLDRLQAARTEIPHPSWRDEDRHAEVGVLAQAGLLHVLLNQMDLASPVIEESLALARSLGQPGPLALAHETAAVEALHRGDPAASEALLLESKRYFEEAGDRGGVAVCVGNLGVVAGARNDYQTARTHCERYLALSRELGDRLAEAKALTNLGYTSIVLGERERAHEFLQTALAIHESDGDIHGEARTRQMLADLDITDGRFDRARAHLIHSLRLLKRVGDRAAFASTLATCIRLEHQEGRYVQAARILTPVQRFREAGEITFRPETLAMLSQWNRDLRERLGEEELSRVSCAAPGEDLYDLIALVDPGRSQSGLADGGKRP